MYSLSHVSKDPIRLTGLHEVFCIFPYTSALCYLCSDEEGILLV